MKRRVISIVLACSIVAGTSYQAFATPISDGQKEKIEETRNNYNELNSKTAKLEAELNTLTANMNPVFMAKEENDKKIGSIQAESAQIEKEIPEIQALIKEKEAILGKRMNGIYKSGGQMNYLSMILSSDSIGDFIGTMDAVTRIMQVDKDVIEEVEADKKVLDDKIKKLEDQKVELDKLNEDNIVKIKEFEQMEDKQEKLMEELEVEKKEVNLDLTDLERPLAKPLIDIINNSSSTKAQIETAVGSLRGLRNQIVSPSVDKEIVSAMEKGKNRIDELAVVTPPPLSGGGSSTEGSGNQGGGSVVAPPASGSTVDRIIANAYTHVGKPYIYGATGPNAFDCSGLTQYAYRAGGINISRTTYTQVNEGRHVPRNQLQRGDLIFTEGTPSNPTHVGIYIGNNQMIHAARPGVGVKVGSVYKYVTARRIL